MSVGKWETGMTSVTYDEKGDNRDTSMGNMVRTDTLKKNQSD